MKWEILQVQGFWIPTQFEPAHNVLHYGGNIYIDECDGCYVIYRKVE